MTKLEITIRKDDNGQWRTYTHSTGDVLPMKAMDEIAIGVLNAKDYLEDTKHLLGTTDMPSEEYINW